MTDHSQEFGMFFHHYPKSCFFFQKCTEDVQFKILSAQVVSTVYCSASKVPCLRIKYNAPIWGTKPRLLDSEISAATGHEVTIPPTTEDLKDSKIHIISMKSFSIPKTMLLGYKRLNIWMKSDHWWALCVLNTRDMTHSLGTKGPSFMGATSPNT